MSPEGTTAPGSIAGQQPAPHPFFDSRRYPWHRVEAKELHRALYDTVRDSRLIEILYYQSGSNLLPLPQNVGPHVIWKEALELLVTAGCFKQFCELLLADSRFPPVHPYVLAAQQASHSSEDAVAMVCSGLRALNELLEEPEVRAALAAFHAVFEGADRRIRRMADYKDLHDRLHDLQMRCYAPISSASRQFPGAGTKAQLQLDAITLRGEIRKIREVAGRETLADEELSWIEEVVEAADTLEQGLEQTDPDKVQLAARRLRQVVHTQPTWVDTMLVQSARELDLPQLVSKLGEVSRTLEQVGAEPDQRGWVESGTQELGRLDESLSQARLRHREWQRVENGLQMLEVTLGQPWEEVARAWQVVSTRIAKLWVVGEAWSEQLQASGKLLQQAIDARNESETVVFFSGFRTFATDRFYQVDKDLKRLCDQIAPIGRDLDQVVARLS